MSFSLVVTLVGALVAVAWTGVLAARTARQPSGYLIASTLALLGLAVGLAAQAFGYLLGYNEISFRAMELGGQVVAPLAVCLGIVEVSARRPGGRFAMRLTVGAMAIVGLAVLGADPLSAGAAGFSKAFPDPVTYYQYLPQALIAFVLGPFAAFTGLVAVIAGLVRGRGGSGVAQAPVVAGVAALLLAAPAIYLGLEQLTQITVTLSVTRFFGSAYLLVAVLIWLAANLARRSSEAGTAARAVPGWEAGGQAADQDFHQIPDRALARGETGTGRPFAGADKGDGYPQFGNGRTDDGWSYGSVEADGRYPGLADLVNRVDVEPGLPGTEKRSVDFFGQIQILTLIEGQADRFDAITKRIVAKVRSREPGTLVYIVHEVPNAPAQRILYEVYRDWRAYEEHLRQPYVVGYAEERRPMVLAADVIEVGLQQAKVSPLPSLSDIIEQSGIDLTGVTEATRPRPAHPGAGAAGYVDRAGAPVDRPGGPRPDSVPDVSFRGDPRAFGYAEPRQAGPMGPAGPRSAGQPPAIRSEWSGGRQLPADPPRQALRPPAGEPRPTVEPGAVDWPEQFGQHPPRAPGPPVWPRSLPPAASHPDHPRQPWSQPHPARNGRHAAADQEPVEAGDEQQYQRWADFRQEDERHQQ